MPTTADYLADLVTQKNALVDAISESGIETSQDEKLNTLVPKAKTMYEKGKTDFLNALTKNGTDFSYFFYYKGFTNFPEIDTSKGTIFSYMFSDCSEMVNAPNLDTTNAENMAYMFSSCSKLKSVPLYDTSKVENMTRMFSGCSALTTVPNFVTDKVTNFSYMFNGTAIVEAPLFSYASATNVSNMFYGCTKLTQVYYVHAQNCTAIGYMFYGCTSLVTVGELRLPDNVTTANTYQGAFDNCTALENLTISGFIKQNTFNVSKCTKLTVNSLRSILLALYPVTSTKTVTFGTTNLAKLTDEEKAIATNNGWTLA